MVSPVVGKRRRLLYCPIDDEHYVGFDCSKCFDYECFEYRLAVSGFLPKDVSISGSRKRRCLEFRVRRLEIGG